MSYAAGTVKIQIGGALPRGEKWSMGWQYDAGGPLNQNNVDAAVGRVLGVVNEASGPVFTWLGTLLSGTTLTFIHGYGYNGGKAAAFQASASPSKAGGSAPSAAYPLQCAVVASLLTGKPGRRFRGRMYFPVASFADPSGQLASSYLTIVANAAKEFLTCAQSAGTGLPLNPVVASATGGVNTPITSVYVDSRLDIQRNRARSETVLRNTTVAIP